MIRLDKMSGIVPDMLSNFLFKEGFMDLLTGNIRNLFFRYLSAAFGSALIIAIYSIVDCAAVGQYEGADGVAALATVAPIWNIVYSLGLLFGIGGAVLMSTARGSGNKEYGDEIFTCALIGTFIAAAGAWILILFFDGPMLRFFGADEQLLVLAKRYIYCIKLAAPLFVFGQFLAAFLRNDKAPGKATAAVLSGGVFNMVGDYFFVFICDMGIFGAGLATALGQILSITILCSHFFSKSCTLKLVKPKRMLHDMGRIVVTGFATFFIDIAMGVLSLMFNNQIMRYAGASSLAVYGVIININILVQSCAYGVGQASQPLLSVNFGAGKIKRIRQTFFWSLVTTAAMSMAWAGISIGFPLGLTKIFMNPSEEIVKIAPGIMRTYFLSFLLLPLNIYSTYYFQALVKPAASFAVSVLRGVVLSGFLIYTLPAVFGTSALWLAMPITELIIAVLVIALMIYFNRQLSEFPKGETCCKIKQD